MQAPQRGTRQKPGGLRPWLTEPGQGTQEPQQGTLHQGFVVNVQYFVAIVRYQSQDAGLLGCFSNGVLFRGS